MEDRRGNGIFLGVVSIATLIVAIIGATFAYFSASTQSANNAVSLQAYEFKLGLDMEQIYPEHPEAASGLIPLKAAATISGAEAPNNTNILYALNVARNRCVDDNGMQVCALYKVTIKNQGGNPMTLTGTLETTKNEKGSEESETATPFQNLTYQGVTGELNSLILDGTSQKVKEAVGEKITISNIFVSGATINQTTGFVEQEGVGEGYVLIYLNDNNSNQSGEMGAKYEGKLTYSSGDGGNALTGTFRIGGTDEEEDVTSPSDELGGE